MSYFYMVPFSKIRLHTHLLINGVDVTGSTHEINTLQE